jgi:hypothetical protein
VDWVGEDGSGPSGSAQKERKRVVIFEILFSAKTNPEKHQKMF